MIANFALAMSCLFVGWVGLLPARRALAPVLYHLSSMPVGVIGWSFVAALATVLGVRPTLAWSAVGLALYAAAIAGLCRVCCRGRLVGADEPIGTSSGGALAGWRGYAVFGGVYTLVAAALAASGLTIAGFDGYTHYELSGWFLHDTGAMSVTVMGSRNILLPAIHMGTRVLGGDWTYVVYPLFSLTALGLLAWALWHVAFPRLSTRTRALLTALVVICVAVLPAWVFHTFNVHSNMVSAVYVTLSVVAMLVAARAFPGVERASAAPAAASLVAGLAIAGIALARPDGLAYVFAGLLFAAACHFVGLIDRRAVGALYGVLVLQLVVVYGAAFAKLGLWREDAKLLGTWAAALLVAIVLFGLVTLTLPRIKILRAHLGLTDFLKIVVLVDLALIALVAMTVPEQFVLAARNMVANLLLKGGWGQTWIVLVVLLTITLFFPPPDEEGRWSNLLLFAVIQFMAIAIVVHGATHPGRIRLTDSFNRAALHIVPVAFLYVATYLGRLLMYPDSRAGTGETAEVERGAAPE